MVPCQVILKKARLALFQKRHAFIRERKDWKTVTEFRNCKFFAGPANKIEAVLLQNDGKYEFQHTPINRNIVCIHPELESKKVKQ